MNEVDREEYEALILKLNDIRNEIYNLENFLVTLKGYMNDASMINTDLFGEDTFKEIRDAYEQINDNITYIIIPQINTDLSTM